MKAMMIYLPALSTASAIWREMRVTISSSRRSIKAVRYRRIISRKCQPYQVREPISFEMRFQWKPSFRGSLSMMLNTNRCEIFQKIWRTSVLMKHREIYNICKYYVTDNEAPYADIFMKWCQRKMNSWLIWCPSNRISFAIFLARRRSEA